MVKGFIMKLDISIEVNEKNRVNGFLKKGDIKEDIFNLTALNAIKAIEEFIDNNESESKNVYEEIADFANSLKEGEEQTIQVIGKNVRVFRVILSDFSSDTGKAFKTKYRNGLITVKRVSPKDNKTLKEKVKEVIDSINLSVGESKEVEITGGNVKSFRTSLFNVSKDINQKFKTSYNDKMITITRTE